MNVHPLRFFFFFVLIVRCKAAAFIMLQYLLTRSSPSRCVALALDSTCRSLYMFTRAKYTLKEKNELEFTAVEETSGVGDVGNVWRQRKRIRKTFVK